MQNRDEDGNLMEIMTRADIDQLRQIAAKSPHPGVWSGDLINKPSTRRLIDMGLVQNSGRSASALSYISLSKRGTEILQTADAMIADGFGK
jgi:hypothetical protein